MLKYIPTPLQELSDPILTQHGVRLFVKREDLNHQKVSGNKWWKLKYNLQEAIDNNHHVLLTYGGAFSNHILATAAAAQEIGMKSIGVIRGEETLPLNPILSMAKEMGMHLHYVTREAFKNKNEEKEVARLAETFGRFYAIPEGGSNELAIKGVIELRDQLGDDFDYLCCAVGTGATMAGLIRSLQGKKEVLGFLVLRGEGFEAEVNRFNPYYANWTLMKAYHEGGYARTSASLNEFMQHFMTKHSIPVEHVYTGKMFNGIFDLVSKGHFKEGSKILVIHSGGIH